MRSPRPRCSGVVSCEPLPLAYRWPLPLCLYTAFLQCVCVLTSTSGKDASPVGQGPPTRFHPTFSAPLKAPHSPIPRSRGPAFWCALEGHNWSSGEVRVKQVMQWNFKICLQCFTWVPFEIYTIFSLYKPLTFYSLNYFILFLPSTFFFFFPLMFLFSDVFIYASKGTTDFLVSLSPKSFDYFLVTSVTFLSAAVSVENRGPPSPSAVTAVVIVMELRWVHGAPGKHCARSATRSLPPLMAHWPHY